MAPPKKPGPAPVITEDAIGDAVLEIGLSDATVKTVANRLGVSAPGLYHHVNGRDDLRRIAIERLVTTSVLPDADDKTWSTWLREVCRSLRSLAARPEFLAQYTAGAIPVAHNARRIEEAITVLRQKGLSHEGALDAFHVIGQLAIGAAAEDTRQASYQRSGQPSDHQLRATLDLDPASFPNLVTVHDRTPEPQDSFERRLDIVIAGIATINNIDDW